MDIIIRLGQRLEGTYLYVHFVVLNTGSPFQSNVASASDIFVEVRLDITRAQLSALSFKTLSPTIILSYICQVH